MSCAPFSGHANCPHTGELPQQYIDLTEVAEGFAGITGQLRVHEAGQEVAVSVKTCSSSLSDTDLDEAPMIKTYGSLKGISREDLLELKSTLLASPKHLRVPRSPIRENIIQVRYSLWPESTNNPHSSVGHS